MKDTLAETRAKYPHFNPHLAIVQVGGREDSSLYVKMKEKAANEVSAINIGPPFHPVCTCLPYSRSQTGILFTHEKLPESITQADLLRKVKELNNRHDVHGILVQMPLPKHIDEIAVVEAIDYQKDVDG